MDNVDMKELRMDWDLDSVPSDYKLGSLDMLLGDGCDSLTDDIPDGWQDMDDLEFDSLTAAVGMR